MRSLILVALLATACAIPGPPVSANSWRCRNVAVFVPVGQPDPICPHWEHTPPLEDGQYESERWGTVDRYLCYCEDMFNG